MPSLSTVLFAVLVAPGMESRQDENLTAEQFLRFVKSQQSAIHDVAYAWEGEKVYVGPPDEKIQKSIQFQGRYALRSDGSAYFETVYEGEGVDPTLAHSVEAVLKGTAEMAFLTRPNPRVRTQGAGPGTFFSETSPEMFHSLWRFQTLSAPSDFGYHFMGWEDVDGRRCAHIEFNSHPKHPGGALKEMWIDLERGAHPLRIRNSDGDHTVYVIDQIKLNQFDLPDGQKVWFPVGGRMSQYHRNGEYTRDPAFVTTSYVLNGTIFFNQGLGDGVFHVKGDAFRPSFEPKRVAAAPATVPRKPVDFAQAERDLDKALADPKRQAVALDASATTRDEVNAWSFLPWALGIGAAVALVAAVWLVIRRGGV